MSEISAADVKALRERTGAGMLDCRNALVETGGDIEEALRLDPAAARRLLSHRSDQ